MAVCRVFAGDLAGTSRAGASHQGHAAWSLAPLIRRLYEQAREAGVHEIVQACLDEVDRLAGARVGWRGVCDSAEV